MEVLSKTGLGFGSALVGDKQYKQKDAYVQCIAIGRQTGRRIYAC